MKKTLFCLAAVVALALPAADVNRRRDVIFYHYDNGPVMWPKSLPYTAEGLINGFGKNSRSWDGLSAKALAAEVKPDTFVYVPLANFANLSAMVPSNEPQLQQPSEKTSWLRGMKNVLPEIKKAGKAHDPVSVMCKWAHENKREFFVGLCVNDSQYQYDYNPALKIQPPPFWGTYMVNSFKSKHLDWLMGSHSDMPPLKGLSRNHPNYGSWLYEDYGQQEVRAKFTAIAKEMIAGYDIDGLMLDFCRGPYLFRSVVHGGTAGAAQCQMITEMVGLISAAAKEKGCLLAVRVPDSPQACKDAGMDVEAWCAQKFVDLLFFGGLELNRWSVAADFAKKCGVPFYASIDNSRIYSYNDEGGREDDQRLPRQCQEVYRARVTEARLAGAKGIMYSSGRDEAWNGWWCYTNPKLFQPAQDKIRLENKRYFVNYRRHSGAFVKDMKKYTTIQGQALVTSSPKEIKGTAKYEIYVWDDMATLKRERIVPKCYLTTIIEIPSGWNIDVNLNGKPLKVIKKRAGSQIYAIPDGVVVFGKNEVVLSVKGSNRRSLVPRIGNIGIDVLFNGDLEVLKKAGNVAGSLSTAGGGAAAKGASKDNAAATKKGGRK